MQLAASFLRVGGQFFSLSSFPSHAFWRGSGSPTLARPSSSHAIRHNMFSLVWTLSALCSKVKLDHVLDDIEAEQRCNVKDENDGDREQNKLRVLQEWQTGVAVERD